MGAGNKNDSVSKPVRRYSHLDSAYDKAPDPYSIQYKACEKVIDTTPVLSTTPVSAEETKGFHYELIDAPYHNKGMN